MARRAKSGTPGGAEAQDADAGQATEGAPIQGGAAVSEEKTSTKRKRKSTLDWRHVEEPGKFQGKFRICPIKVTGKRRKVDIAAFLDTGDENSPNQIQRSPFENTSLGDSPYRVEPSKTWLAMSKYKRFTLQNAEFNIHDYIHVKPMDSGDAKINTWIARVLEIRAEDDRHVWLRVYWMYRPEDLPMGRQPYHGSRELIASNAMDFVDAHAVEDKAEVIHWEENDKEQVLDPGTLYWRQTFDASKNKGTLSDLPKHCIDLQPCNTDQLLIQCDKCKKWLHGPCIEKDAVRKAYAAAHIAEDATTPPPEPQKKRGRKKKAKKIKVDDDSTSPANAMFSAEVRLQDGKARVTLTDKCDESDTNTEVFPVECLLCGKLVDDEQPAEGVSDIVREPTSKTEPGLDTVVKESSEGSAAAGASTDVSASAIGPSDEQGDEHIFPVTPKQEDGSEDSEDSLGSSSSPSNNTQEATSTHDHLVQVNDATPSASMSRSVTPSRLIESTSAVFASIFRRNRLE